MRSIRYRFTKGMAFSSLSIVGLLIFYIIPFFMSINFLLFDSNHKGLGSEVFYETMTSDAFLLALKNMLLFFICALPLLFVISLSLAYATQYLLKLKVKGSSALFTLHMIPMVLPSAIIVYVVKVIFSRYGVFNAFLVSDGKLPVKWLSSNISFVLLLLLYLWKNYGYCMIIFMGGLESIEPEVLEAAKLDGAKGIKMLSSIILGQLKSFLRFFVLIAFIGIFKLYRESYLLFGSYPNKSVYMLQNYINNCINNLSFQKLIISGLSFIILISVIIKLFLRGDNE